VNVRKAQAGYKSSDNFDGRLLRPDARIPDEVEPSIWSDKSARFTQQRGFDHKHEPGTWVFIDDFSEMYAEGHSAFIVI